MAVDQKHLMLFNSDEYKEVFLFEKAHNEEIVSVETISDFLFLTADCAGTIKLWKYDDERFTASVVQEIKTNNKLRVSTRGG